MKALEGLRVVVTRAAHQADELASLLREHGAIVLLVPVIGITAPKDPGPLQTAARSDVYQWIVFTSANAVLGFVSELKKGGRWPNARIAAVGAATKQIAESNGFTVQLVPAEYVAESLLEAFASENLSGCRILIPSAAVTRDVVAPALRQRGARVDVVEAYRNIVPPEAPDRVQSLFVEPYPDWVTFASPSAATNLVKLAGSDALMHSKIASIGPVTSEAVRDFGLQVEAEALVHTVEGLVQAMVDRPG